jgi:hypothetical protein
MTNNNDKPSELNESDTNEQSANTSVKQNWPIVLILSIIGFYLVTEHTAHLLGILPWLILLACPFIHIFMHRGHDHASHKHNHTEVKNE